MTGPNMITENPAAKPEGINKAHGPKEHYPPTPFLRPFSGHLMYLPKNLQALVLPPSRQERAQVKAIPSAPDVLYSGSPSPSSLNHGTRLENVLIHGFNSVIFLGSLLIYFSKKKRTCFCTAEQIQTNSTYLHCLIHYESLLAHVLKLCFKVNEG